MAAKKDNVLENQINFDNKVHIENTTRKVKLKFYKFILDKNPNMKMFDDIEIKKIFDKKISLSDFEMNNEKITPNIEVIENTDKFCFVVYSNKKAISENENLLHKDKKVEDISEYKFERFTYGIIDYEKLNFVVIDNKKASTWKESFIKLFESYGYQLYVNIYQDSKLLQYLQKEPIKKIHLTTSSVETKKDVPYCISEEVAQDGFIENIYFQIKIKNKETTSAKLKQFIEKGLLSNKSEYGKIKIELATKFLDLMENSISKNVQVDIPKRNEPDSIQMQKIKEKLISALLELE